MRVGDFAHEGGDNISVVDTDSYWIDGYFEETKLARVCIGDRVEAKLMGYAEPILGHVTSVTRGIGVSDAAGGTQGLPNVNPVFTWVRLAERPHLAAAAHLVAIDPPGFGGSDYRQTLMNPKAMGHFILKVADALALKASEGVAGLSAAMRGLIAARTAVMTAVAAIDADMRRMTRASAACRRLMTIPGVGQLTALAFVAAIDDPSRIRRSRDIGAYLGLVPRRYQSGEVDYVGGISKCGDRRVRTLLYEAANVMLTRYKGQLKLKDWAFAIARRSTMRKARVALARRLAIIMHAMLRDGTEFAPT